jgi:hypothetical protein
MQYANVRPRTFIDYIDNSTNIQLHIDTITQFARRLAWQFARIVAVAGIHFEPLALGGLDG